MAGGEQAGQQGGFLGPSPTGGGAGGSGVTSFNGQTGAVTGTLASIYAFGLSDNPPADNVFHMPDGDWYFPGNSQSTGGSGYEVGFIETQHIAGNSDPFNYVRFQGDSTESLNREFNAYSINDPVWNGNPATRAAVSWSSEAIAFGNAPDGNTARNNDSTLALRGYGFSQSLGWTYPNPPGNGRGSYHDLQLWNPIDAGLRIMQRIDGFGQSIAIVQSNQHGITPVSTASQLFDHVHAAGDGTGWLASYNQGISFQNQHVKGGFTVTTIADTGDPTTDSWVASMWAYLHGSGDTITEVLRCYADVGPKVLVGGFQLPDGGDHSTAAKSDAGTAKFLYDNTAGHVYVSINAGAYTLLI